MKTPQHPHGPAPAGIPGPLHDAGTPRTIRASLGPPSDLRGPAAAEALALLRQARRLAKARTLRSRQRALRFARYSRSRGFQQGHEAGLREAERSFAILAREVRAHYGEILEATRQDAFELASLACRELVGAALDNAPEAILPLFNEALTIMKASRKLSVRYHQRYQHIASRLASSTAHEIVLTEASEPGAPDFVIGGEHGEVEFCWRRAVERHLEARLRNG